MADPVDPFEAQRKLARELSEQLRRMMDAANEPARRMRELFAAAAEPPRLLASWEPDEPEPAEQLEETTNTSPVRLPHSAPKETFEDLERLLAERARYKTTKRRLPDDLTLAAIARRIGLDPDAGRERVRRTETQRDRALRSRGWDLVALVSRPEFCAQDGERYWPTERNTALALGSPARG